MSFPSANGVGNNLKISDSKTPAAKPITHQEINFFPDEDEDKTETFIPETPAPKKEEPLPQKKEEPLLTKKEEVQTTPKEEFVPRRSARHVSTATPSPPAVQAAPEPLVPQTTSRSVAVSVPQQVSVAFGVAAPVVAAPVTSASSRQVAAPVAQMPANPAVQPTQDPSSLENISRNLGLVLDGSPAFPKRRNNTESVVWLSKWVDYSGKYGLGYQLTDKCIGVYFNDSTGAVLHHDQLLVFSLFFSEAACLSNNSLVFVGLSNFTYFDGKQDNQGQAYPVSDYPQELEKKVILLRHFKSYMEENLNRGQQQQAEVREGPIVFSAGVVALKKWVRTKHAMLFRLSNRVIQVNFFDHTKMILSQGGLCALYVDQNRVIRSLYLPSDLPTSPDREEVAKRLKYIKEVIDQLVCSKKK